MSTYTIIKSSTDKDIIVRTDEDGAVWFIPSDPANSDYQVYLEHLTENPTEGDE